MSDPTVYTGIWRNWAPDRPLAGLTWTVSPAGGPPLIAFLALFVAVAGSHLWGIICLALHQWRASRTGNDRGQRTGLHHQRQALLANGYSNVTVVWMLCRLQWAWRATSGRDVLGFIGLTGAALAHVAVVTLLGIFSSRLVLVGDQVLARGTVCGWMPNSLLDSTNASQTPSERMDAASVSNTFGRYTATESLKYARACYGNSVDRNELDSAPSCALYARPRIELYTNASVPCPFAAGICAQPTAFAADTQLVDANEHLGLNLPPGNDLRFRKQLTCVPLLAEERYSTGWNTTPPVEYGSLPGDEYNYYYLGPQLTTPYTQYTSKYSQMTAWKSHKLGHATAYSGYLDNLNTSFFSPIPDLRVPDGDITVLFLANQITYLDEVTDPWFRATTRVNLTGAIFTGLTGPVYAADRVLSTIGCIERYQFCAGEQCSPLGGIYDNQTSPYLGLTLNDAQKAAFDLILSAAWGSGVHLAILYLRDNLLLAKERLWMEFGAISAPLSPRQWELEVENLASVVLAAMQRRIAEFAAPPDHPISTLDGVVGSRRFVIPAQAGAAAGGQASLCDSIRIRNTEFYNIGVIRLIILLVVGISLIILNALCLPGLVFWVRRRVGWDETPNREWAGDHVLQLQRKVFESRGLGPWSAREVDDLGAIPVTIDRRMAFSARSWGSFMSRGEQSAGEQKLQLIDTKQ